jgi:[protein-PII] uridylyltransferase
MARTYTDLMDRFIRSLFLGAGFREKIRESQGDGLTVVGLGSYGRRELCLGSDVDLMVIHRDRLSPEMSRVISHVIYPLWDAKLDVGQTILTVPECVRLAMSDFRVMTSLLDARFLLGSRSFYRLFQVAFWSRLEREKRALLQEFLLFQKKRDERYKSEDYFVEPDIKEGLGGLRDLHFMSWMARVYFGCSRLSEIRRFPSFSHFEIDKLSDSSGFLLKVRNLLYHLTGRKEDRLLLSYQKKLAPILGYLEGPHMGGPEKFMKQVYLHLNRIRYGHEEFQVKALDIIDPLPSDSVTTQLSREFQVVKGNVVLKERGLARKEPTLVLKAINEANQRGLFLGSEFIWETRKMIVREGKKLAESPEARDLFLRLILDPKNSKIIRLALEIGLIGLFIPEFKKIRNMTQLGYYHVETVDLHSLKTLEVLNGISRGDHDDQWPILREIFSELEHPDWLFLVGLLHDIGKGYRGDHAEKGAELIRKIIGRLGINGDARERMPFLVRHHLLLARISQRRDLTDEKTSLQVAQVIQDQETLRLLFLLTVADSFATGPMARSNWKIMLLIELFFKVARLLDKGTLVTADATHKIESQKSMILKKMRPEYPENIIQELIEQVSSRYFLGTPVEDMERHFRMALSMKDKTFSWTLEKLNHAPVTRVILVTYDKPGLFSKMVGVFALNNIKVLSANIFTLKNGLAFDTYEVTNPLDPYREEEKWEQVRREIAATLEGTLALDELINEKGSMVLSSESYRSPVRKVRVNNEVSDFFTVIDFSAEERVGQLYQLAKALFRLGLDIRFAKVNSDQEKMTGVFYVSTSDGQKIHEETDIEKIEREILSKMSG